MAAMRSLSDNLQSSVVCPARTAAEPGSWRPSGDRASTAGLGEGRAIVRKDFFAGVGQNPTTVLWMDVGTRQAI
jgi:hypothetical protein